MRLDMRYLPLMALVWLGCLCRESLAQSPKIGLLMPLTGAAAYVFEECRRGLEVAYHSFWLSQTPRPFPVELEYADTHDDPKDAVTEFKRMLEAESLIAVIATRSKEAIPVNPLSAKAHLPLIAISAHPALISGNNFALRLYPSAQKEGAALAELALSRLLKRSAIVTVENEWNLALSKSFKDKFEALGAKVVADETVAENDLNFAALISKIRAAAPESIFVNLLNLQAGLFVKKLQEQGLRAQLLSNFWIQHADALNTAGAEALEGALFVEIDINKPNFTAAFNARFPGIKFTGSTYLCYAALGSVLQTLAKFDEPPSRLDFSKTLSAIDTAALLDGRLEFIGREAQFSLRPRMLKAGRAVDAE